MEESPQPPTTTNDEIGLLDLLVTLTENLRLLIVGPLIVGFCALGIGYMLPQTFESVALLQAERPLDPQAAPVGMNAAAIAGLMTSASVIDPVAATIGVAIDNDVEEARRKLRDQIKPVVGRGDKLLTLTVSGASPEQAQTLAREVLRQTYTQSRPKGGDLIRLEAQLAAAKARAENSQNASASLAKWLGSPGGGGNEVARGYADLLTVNAVARTQILRLETEIEGLTEAQLIQPPTLPRRASQPKKGLMAVGATLAAGLVLLVFVFMRQALSSSAANPEIAGKLARIRKSLRLK